MQSLRVKTLRWIHFESGSGSTHKGRRGHARFSTQFKGAKTRVGSTSHVTVLLMPTQTFMRAMLEIENAFGPSTHVCSSVHSYIC